MNSFSSIRASAALLSSRIVLPTSSSFSVVSAVLLDKRGRVVGKGESDKGEIAFSVEDPELWSPDKPYLYQLECSVLLDGETVDRVGMAVGFKDFRTKGKRFYLNGKATSAWATMEASNLPYSSFFATNSSALQGSSLYCATQLSIASF